MNHPTAFISYSRDSTAHDEWVARLATQLRSNGIDVKLDQWHAVLGSQLPEFMEREIRENDFILIICTPQYRAKSDGREGSVGYEGDIMTGEVLTRGNQSKFIPVLASGIWKEAAPTWLLGKSYADLSDPNRYESEYQSLWLTLSAKAPVAPPLGPLSALQQDLGQSGGQLSKEEIDILVASHGEGRLILIRSDAFGTWLRADKTDFADNDDRAVQAIYLEALESLRHRGFVRRESSDYFELTGSGFSFARRFAKTLEKQDSKKQQPASEKDADLLEYRHICRNGSELEILVELPRIAYIGQVLYDFNFYFFSAFYQANQGKIDVGGFSTRAAAENEKHNLETDFQAWANRPL